MADFEVIHLPKETVSDDKYKILTVAVPTRTKVLKNQVLLEFQTSKATMELVSPSDGYFHTWIEAGQDLPVGAVLGLISQESTVPEVAMAKLRATTADRIHREAKGDSAGVRFSKAAEELMTKHGLQRELFVGLKLVRREDVERVLNTSGSGAPLEKTTPRVTIKGSASSVIIIGGGGHAKICIDILRRMGTFEIAGVVDAKTKIGSTVLGVPVIGRDADLEHFRAQGVGQAVCGLGATANHLSRTTLFDKIREAGFQIPNLVHPTAVIEPSARLGEGNQVMAGAIIGSDVRIGNNCIINAGAVVSHDSILNDNVHVAPGAILGGNVIVGRDTLIGMGATIYLGVTLGSHVIVPNGMNVFVTVPDGTMLRHQS